MPETPNNIESWEALSSLFEQGPERKGLLIDTNPGTKQLTDFKRANLRLDSNGTVSVDIWDINGETNAPENDLFGYSFAVSAEGTITQTAGGVLPFNPDKISDLTVYIETAANQTNYAS